MDDVIIYGSDATGIMSFWEQFHTRSFGTLCCFLGIEAAHSSQAVAFSQRKYVLALLCFGAWHVDTSTDSSVKIEITIKGWYTIRYYHHYSSKHYLCWCG